MSGPDADTYAKALIVAKIDGHDVFGNIRKDFDTKGVAQSDDQIQRVMRELMRRAESEIKAGR